MPATEPVERAASEPVERVGWATLSEQPPPR